MVKRRFAGLSLLFLSLSLAFPISIGWARQRSILNELEQDIIQLLQRVKPSVVTISATVGYRIGETKERSFLNLGRDETEQSIEITNIGSGIVLFDGYILTKTSVVENSKKILVSFHDGAEVEAEYLGHDPEWGLAVLRVDKKNLQPANIGKSETVQAGCWVMIVGNSLGISPAMSWGTVNCIRNDGIIQISANVPAGYAGGPIFNVEGDLIGVLAVHINPMPDEVTLGASFAASETVLAYPVDEVVSRVKKVIKEAGSRAWLGIAAEDWPGRPGGAHITRIVPGSPAESARLEVGDIITSINGMKLHKAADFADYIKQYQPGDTLEFAVLRGRGTQKLKVRLGNRDARRAPRRFAERPPQFDSSVEGTVTIDVGKSEALRKEKLLLKINELQRQLNQLRSAIEKHP